MKLQYLFQSTYRQIKCRKATFLLSTILLCITFLVIGFQSIIVGLVSYQKHVMNNILNENSNNIYILDLTKYMLPTERDKEALSMLINGLSNIEGIKYSGVYYEDYLDIGAGSQETLVISSDMIKLCDINNEQGEDVVFTVENGETLSEQSHNKMYPAIVGNDLKDWYPIGYTFTDSLTQAEYIVTDILEPESYWIKDRVQFGDINSCLDDYIIIDETARLEHTDVCLSGLTAFCYVIDENSNGELIKENVKTLSQDCGLDLYNIHSISELLKKNQGDAFGDSLVYYLMAGMLIISVIVVIMCSMINILLRKSSIGVMYAIGYSSQDVQRMVLLENTIKMGIATLIAYLFWSVNEYNIFHQDVSIIRYMLPKLIIGIIMITAISSCLPILQIRRMYPAMLIGGKD